MSTPTPTPDPWIADGYDLRQKNGRMIAYFGPHHTPADEYPLSCRLQDEANAQWVAAARNELAAAKAECERLKFAAEGHLLKTIQQQAELTRLRAELAVAENWVEHHSKHADDLIAENVRLRAEVEALKQSIESGQRVLREDAERNAARAERAEAERDALAKDKARLDWLSVSDAWFDYPATGAFTPDTMRAAIDAAMKP